MAKLPYNFQRFFKEFPEIWKAHRELTLACSGAGPLDRRTRELIKVGISSARGLETACKRHAIMAKEAGATTEEIIHAVLMNVTTCGFPAAAAGYQWVREALAEKRPKPRKRSR